VERSATSNGRGERGDNERRQGARGRGQSYTGATRATKSGLCKKLDNNVFDYRHKAAADEMRISWEKLVQYVRVT
jgi:hypothetical protein